MSCRIDATKWYTIWELHPNGRTWVRDRTYSGAYFLPHSGAHHLLESDRHKVLLQGEDPHAQTVRSMAVRLCRALPPGVGTAWFVDAGLMALDDWRSYGGYEVEPFETAVTRVFLLVLQTDERVPARIRQGFADVTTLQMPPRPTPIPAI